MNRRDFLKSLLIAPLALIGAKWLPKKNEFSYKYIGTYRNFELPPTATVEVGVETTTFHMPEKHRVVFDKNSIAYNGLVYYAVAGKVYATDGVRTTEVCPQD